jgi:phosphopantothenoylcysteine synthetase/decarboxylase
MKILITGGNTAIPIDKVRVISNIFKGKTASGIAAHAVTLGHDVTLIGNPGMEVPLFINNFISYKTYNELASLMEEQIRNNKFDAIVHSAAVSDYSVSRVLDESLQPLDNNKKVGSNHDKLYLELVPTKKLIDQIRSQWGFTGVLVKFKLQVGISDKELLKIAMASRKDANIIVANCLEWARERAYLVEENTTLEVKRNELSSILVKRIEELL